MILDAMVARAVAIERVHERNFDDLLHGQIPPENLGRVKGMPPLAEVEYLDNSEVA